MKKYTKVLSMVAALALCAGTLGACGDGNTDSGNSGSSGSSGGSSASGGSTADSGSKGNVALKWIQIGGQPKDLTDVTKAWNEYSSEKIGVTCEMTFLDWGVWGDRVNAIINSGEPYDIMFTNGDKYTNGVNLGAFADITDLLPTAAKELYEYIPQKVWDGTKIKGRIYSVPTYKDSSQTQYWVWDKQVVEDLKIDYENIETVDELDPVLYQIKDAIAAGTVTGTDYAFPCIKDGINGFQMFYERPAFGIGIRYDDETYTVVNTFEQEDQMTILKYMHKWYKDGIINPDAATKAEPQKWNPVASGQGFPGSDVNWSANNGRDMISHPWGGPLYSTGTILGSVNAISSASKNQEAALKFLQLVNMDPQMRNTIAYGIEGVHYTKNDDNTITRDEVNKDNFNPAQYSQATFFTLWPITPNVPEQWTMVEEWNEKAESSVLLGFSFDPTNVSTEIGNVSVVSDRYSAELYTGTKDPEEIVPKMYEELEKAGLDKIRQEYKKQVDEWVATK